MQSRKLSSVFVVCIILISFGTTFGIFINYNARPMLIYPRFGNPLRTSPTNGTENGNSWLIQEINLWIGIDPIDAVIPTGWFDKARWSIAFEPIIFPGSVLFNGSVNLIEYSELAIHPESPRALKISVAVPATIMPGMYNLYIAFDRAIHPATEGVIPGSYIGERQSMGISANGFQLAETNAIYVPWTDDPTPSDPNPAAPFTLATITDVHVAHVNATQTEAANLDALTNLAYSLTLWSPDLLVITGDLTNSPSNNPNEYLTAFNYYRSLGIPILMTNGNHDQGDLGLFPYYFGSTYAKIDWANLTLITFNSALQINPHDLNWIINGIKTARSQNKPVFLASHIPMVDVFGRQATGGSAAILDAMIKYNVSAVLHGHNHYNLIMDAEKARQQYLSFGDMEEACQIPSQGFNNAPPVTKPNIIITTSGAKASRDNLQKVWPEYQAYEGYRCISMVDNHIVNYTYDLDGDGVRDPSYSQPCAINYSQTSDQGIGTSLTAKSYFTVFNNLTECVPRGRITFMVPKAQSGYQWKTIAGIPLLTRAYLSNATHEFFEFRGNIPAKTTITITLQQQVSP